jgi:hypothetical protein
MTYEIRNVKRACRNKHHIIRLTHIVRNLWSWSFLSRENNETWTASADSVVIQEAFAS